jgi:hypothetical protein
VLIYPDKERMLDTVERRFPARHYVLVDDNLRIPAAQKKGWSNRMTTVFPRQGNYAFSPGISSPIYRLISRLSSSAS